MSYGYPHRSKLAKTPIQTGPPFLEELRAAGSCWGSFLAGVTSGQFLNIPVGGLTPMHTWAATIGLTDLTKKQNRKKKEKRIRLSQ